MMRFILSFVVVCFVVVGINAASAQTPREQQEYRRLEQAAWELRRSRGPEEAADSLSHLAGVLEAAYAEYAAADRTGTRRRRRSSTRTLSATPAPAPESRLWSGRLADTSR